MINSIPKIESNNINVFGQITNKKSPDDYWLPASPQEQPQNMRDNGAVNLKKIRIITPEEARKTNNPGLIGVSIAGATVLTAAGIFFLLKGGPKGLSKNFYKLRNFLGKKLQSSKLENEGDITLLDKSYIYMIKGLDDLLKRFEAVNNFTTFKDVLFKKYMYSSFGLGNPDKPNICKNIHNAITKMFEKIGRQSVVNCYKKTRNDMKISSLLSERAVKNVMNDNNLELIVINGTSKTKREWLMDLKNLNEEVVSDFECYFGERALRTRYYRIKKSAEDLKACFKNLKVFFSKDVFSKFMADSAILKEKKAIQNTVRDNRRQLSYSLTDLAKDAENQIMSMSELIGYKDAGKIKRLRDIRANINKYARTAASDNILKTQIVNDIDSFSMSIRGSLSHKKGIDKDSAEKLLKEMSSLRKQFIYYEPGKIEKMLAIYKNILQENEYRVIEKAYKSGIKSLDKSVHIETEEFVNKLRDFSLGSAPTDILTILGSLGVLGYHLGKSDDNDQRISISLKYGIPALSGIGVALLCNAKLFAGTKSLMIGTISTLIVNKIGVWADNLLKKYKNEKKSQADTSEAKTISPLPPNVSENHPKTV